MSLLMTTLGGAMAGYMISNKKLRDELSGAKDAKAAASILAKHVKNDGEKLGKEAWEFAKSPEVQDKLAQAKKYAEGQYKTAKKQVMGYVKKEAKEMKKMAKKK